MTSYKLCDHPTIGSVGSVVLLPPHLEAVPGVAVEDVVLIIRGVVLIPVQEGREGVPEQEASASRINFGNLTFGYFYWASRAP